MTTQHFTPEILPKLREWFEFNFDTGCSLAQLKRTLTESDYIESEIDAFIAEQQRRLAHRSADRLFDAEPLHSSETAVERFWRRAEVLNSFNTVAVSDGTVKILAKNNDCAIYYFGDFLSSLECDTLIHDANSRMAQSKVVGDSDESDMITASRSSRGFVLYRSSTPTVKRIESRIAKLTDIPISHGEGLQILSYNLGGEYQPHFDYFDAATAGGARMLAEGSQRLASLIMYLSDVENGGGTQFPELSLEFTPVKGAALLFASLGRDSGLLRSSLHAGCPVTSGEKWIATKWLRLTPYEKQGGHE